MLQSLRESRLFSRPQAHCQVGDEHQRADHHAQETVRVHERPSRYHLCSTACAIALQHRSLRPLASWRAAARVDQPHCASVRQVAHAASPPHRSGQGVPASMRRAECSRHHRQSIAHRRQSQVQRLRNRPCLEARAQGLDRAQPNLVEAALRARGDLRRARDQAVIRSRDSGRMWSAHPRMSARRALRRQARKANPPCARRQLHRKPNSWLPLRQ